MRRIFVNGSPHDPREHEDSLISAEMYYNDSSRRSGRIPPELQGACSERRVVGGILLRLVDGITELYAKVATSLPPDVERALRAAYEKEPQGTNAKASLGIMLENLAAARKGKAPLCQDTGIPIFFVKVPSGISHTEVREAILEATAVATERIPLRPNAVDPLTGRNSGNNIGAGFPVMYLEETTADTLEVNLILKGSGSENIGQTYKLPHDVLGAQRDLDGVRRCVLDAVFRAQGRACPPYVIGVGIGASKDQVAVLAKKQLLRKVDDIPSSPQVLAFEQAVLGEINELMIGALGFGGSVTALGVKVGINYRHPASFFVDVSFSCWADRRGTLLW